MQILIYCSHIYNDGNVFGILCGRDFLSVRYISCYNLDTLIDVCRIYQIYLNYNYFSGQKFTYGVLCFEGHF